MDLNGMMVRMLGCTVSRFTRHPLTTGKLLIIIADVHQQVSGQKQAGKTVGGDLPHMIMSLLAQLGSAITAQKLHRLPPRPTVSSHLPLSPAAI